MKRTRETINYSHPSERWNLSGVNTLDGEDRDEAARIRRQREQNKQDLLLQMEENKRAKELERAHEM